MKKSVILLILTTCLVNAKPLYDVKNGFYSWLTSSNGDINIFINYLPEINIQKCGTNKAFNTDAIKTNLSSFVLYENDKEFTGTTLNSTSGTTIKFDNSELKKEYTLNVITVRNTPVAKLSYEDENKKINEINLTIKNILPITTIYYFNKNSKVCYFDMNIDGKRSSKKSFESKAKSLTDEERKNINFFEKIFVSFQNTKYINIKEETLKTQGNDEIKSVKSTLYLLPDYKSVKLEDLINTNTQKFIDIIKGKKGSISENDLKNIKIYEMKKDGIVLKIPNEDEEISYIFISNDELKNLRWQKQTKMSAQFINKVQIVRF